MVCSKAYLVKQLFPDLPTQQCAGSCESNKLAELLFEIYYTSITPLGEVSLFQTVGKTVRCIFKQTLLHS